MEAVPTANIAELMPSGFFLSTAMVFAAVRTHFPMPPVFISIESLFSREKSTFNQRQCGLKEMQILAKQVSWVRFSAEVEFFFFFFFYLFLSRSVRKFSVKAIIYRFSQAGGAPLSGLAKSTH